MISAPETNLAPKGGHKGSTSTRSVPQDSLSAYAAGSDSFKL
jgi:hypothetical protein